MAVDPKEIKKGDVLFYLVRVNNRYDTRFGIVDDLRGAEVVLTLVTFSRKCKINGIPVEDMTFPTEWKKLPKGWTWSTKLFDLTEHYSFTDLADRDDYHVSVDDTDSIKRAFNDGYLIPKIDFDHSRYETEIDKNKGWRIVRKYNEDGPYWTSQFYSNCFLTHKEAKEYADAEEAELRRQAELSDYDWSVEKIDEVLGHYAFWKGLSDEEVKRYRDWILSHERVEDIEVRCAHGSLEWKYCESKRWLAVMI